MKVVSLHRYPVKSMGGEALARAVVTPRGLDGDRRWMMVRDDGRFLTRRELPAMALVSAQPIGHGPTGHGLRLRHRVPGGDGTGELDVPVPPSGAPELPVRVWGDEVTGRDAGPVAAAWLSAIFGRPVRLVHMAEETVRPVHPDYGAAGDQVSFADGFPLLVTTVESLAALNARLDAPLDMARFRPNIVLEGAGAAFAEDGWRRLRIGGLTLRVVKPCTRCVITTQNVETGESTGPEPLRTLKAMGRVWQKMPVFGQNAIPDGPGAIAVGDTVDVL